MIIKTETTVSTPFGWVPRNLVRDIMAAAGIYVKTSGEWAIYSNEVTVEKETMDPKGNAKIEIRKLSLPIRFYNFELNFLKTGSLEEAIKLASSEYLPATLDYGSYGEMMASYKEQYGKFKNTKWDEDDAKAKKQAFEQYDKFQRAFALMDKSKK